MQYSVFIAVCLVIHLLVNIDIFRKKPTVNLPAIKAYRIFVSSIALHFLVDFLWGIFDENKLAIPLYVITIVYFVVMGLTILTWSTYLVKFLQTKGWASKLILYAGFAFFLAEIILLTINIFTPVLFRVDLETCAYTTYTARNIMLYVQISMYLLLIAYTLFFILIVKNSLRRKYISIFLYSVAMVVAISIEIFYPLLPMYSIGCIIGACLLNSFVINDIKEEYKTELEQSRLLVKQGQIQLDETKHIAYSDPLTNIKNKHAYVEEEERIDKLIANNQMQDFAVVVFDLNGLKEINDSKGHDLGDVYIVNACETIKKYFGEDNLYRFGGDEFVAILFDEVYKNRNKILNEFERFIDDCIDTDLPIISSGMSKYRKGSDNTYHAVFNRADKIMYSRKDILKEHHNS